jgi:hypothetical protein
LVLPRNHASHFDLSGLVMSLEANQSLTDLNGMLYLMVT